MERERPRAVKAILKKNKVGSIPVAETYTNMPDWFLTKVWKEFNGGGIAFQQVVLEQLDIHGRKAEPQPTPGKHLSQKFMQNGSQS